MPAVFRLWFRLSSIPGGFKKKLNSEAGFVVTLKKKKKRKIECLNFQIHVKLFNGCLIVVLRSQYHAKSTHVFFVSLSSH